MHIHIRHIKLKKKKKKAVEEIYMILRLQLIGWGESESFWRKVQSKVTWSGTAYRWELPDNRSLHELDVDWTLQVEQSARSRIPGQKNSSSLNTFWCKPR